MKNEISNEEINALDQVWHRLVFGLQKTGEQLWKDTLDGVSTIEISILNIISIKPNVILKEINEMLEIPNSTLTNAVDRLEKRGLIRRVISQRDRRSFGLELTEKGTLAQIEHKKGEAVLWQKILGSFDSAAEREELIRLLGKLVNNLSN
jgi:DNA-binding MarR family transcriptional regulator